MGRNATLSCPAPVAALTVAALALAAFGLSALVVTSEAAAKAPTTHASASPKAKTKVKPSAARAHPATLGARQLRARLSYAPQERRAKGRRQGFADLVGDPESGYGFYALPPEVRFKAARHRAIHRRFWWQNPVLSAMAADAIRNPCWIPAGQEYRCGVYNPIDGVGTPFFAGFYR